MHGMSLSESWNICDLNENDELSSKCGDTTAHSVDTVVHSRCRKLPKALKEWQAYEDLRRTIDDFNETCPLLELMANKAMELRHWERISRITGHAFDVESDNFLLRNLMEAPLLKNKEDIEVAFCLLVSHLVLSV